MLVAPTSIKSATWSSTHPLKQIRGEISKTKDCHRDFEKREKCYLIALTSNCKRIWQRKSMSDSSKSQRSATWGCTHLGIQFRRFQIRTCRKDTVEISKLSIFQIKLKTGDERIYGQKGFAVGKFSKTRFLPLSFDHIIATMSSQTPSWFVEIKSDLATHRLFPIHQSRIFDSTPEIRNFQLALIETDMDVDLHIWMNQSSCGLPEYCNRSTSTPMTFSEHRPISWTRQVKVPRPANAGARGPEAPQRPLRRYPVSADSAVSCGARD